MKNSAVNDFSPTNGNGNLFSLQESETLNIVCLDPCSDARWQRLVEQRQSNVFHSPAWLRVLADTYGWEMAAYVVLDHHDQPVAGVPFCRITDMTGDRLVALPFSDFCDPLVTESTTWRQLGSQLLAARCPITLRCLHNDLPLADERFTVSKRAWWHGLDLRPDEDNLWSQLSGASKRGIKRVQREGVTVRVARTEEEVRQFFLLHRHTRKYKYHLLAQPYQFFRNIWRHFLAQQQGVLLFAIYCEQVIGSVLFLEWKDTLYYKFSTSSPDHLSLRPAELLIWHGIQHGKARGLTHLDFGLSDWDQEGLVGFKRKFASEEKIISFLRHVPEGALLPHEQQARSLLPQLTELFTDAAVPDHVTDRAGEILYRFFA